MHERTSGIERPRGIVSLMTVTISTSGDQRWSTTQSIVAEGKLERRAATAGIVWTRSPSELRRTTRKRCEVSVMKDAAKGCGDSRGAARLIVSDFAAGGYGRVHARRVTFAPDLR